MDAKELMIGDWLYIEDANTKEKYYCRVKKIGTQFIFFDCDEVDVDGLSYDCCFPIPLTPEILEKNGFSYPKQSAWMKIDCPERQLWGCVHTDGAFWLYASGDCDKDESFAEIRYVHELQHALKLCRIEKEIKL